MMQQSIRSQTPGMNPVPNNQGMPGQPMMGGPQGNVSQKEKSNNFRIIEIENC